MQSGVIAMVTCAVFLRLSSVLKLAVLLLVVAVYSYFIQVAFHVLSVSQPDQGSRVLTQIINHHDPLVPRARESNTS